MMRTNAAGKERVAIKEQVMRRDRGRDAGARLVHELNAARVVTCSSTTRKRG